MLSFSKQYNKIFLISFIFILIISAIITLFTGNTKSFIKVIFTLMMLLFIETTSKLIEKFLYIRVSSFLNFSLNTFIFLSMYLGSALDFYSIPHWDTFLHIISGFLTFIVGYSLFLFLNKFETSNVNKNVIICFVLFFSIASTALWEIWEFAGDTLLGGTAQRGLVDTMKDIITGCIIPVIILPYFNKHLSNTHSLIFDNLIAPSERSRITQ